MLKKLKNFVLSFVFPAGHTIDESSQVISLDIPMTPKLLKDFKNTVMMWEFARKVEDKGKYRCSFRENDGTLRKPVRIKPDYPGSFVLYVSKNGKMIATYEIEFFPSIDQVSILNERIHGEKPGYSRAATEQVALNLILTDLEKQL